MKGLCSYCKEWVQVVPIEESRVCTEDGVVQLPVGDYPEYYTIIYHGNCDGDGTTPEEIKED